jgi:LPPG:FO 2-phospho-L-lactate transferase
VSPIVGGAALRGPAAKMCRELGEAASPVTVARHFADLLEAFVIDRQDAGSAGEIEALGMRVLVTSTIMRTRDDRLRLAREVVAFGGQAGR